MTRGAIADVRYVEIHGDELRLSVGLGDEGEAEIVVRLVRDDGRLTATATVVKDVRGSRGVPVPSR